MTDLTPASSFDNVIQLETTTLALGGTGNPMNLQAQALLNRTEFLHEAYAEISKFDQDILDPDAPEKGASIIGRSYVAVDSIVALLAQPVVRRQHVGVASYHQGWAAMTYGPLGGSNWAWSPTKAKSFHNGFDTISPTVPWDGGFSTLNAFQSGVGETAPTGNGCWIRIHGANDIVSWGCLPAVGIDNFLPLNKSFAWSYNNKRRLRGNSGKFEHSTTLDLSYPGLCFRGTDMMGTVLKYTGGGRCMDILGTRPNAGAFSIGIELSDFTVEGNSSVLDIIRIRINHCVLRNVNLREASFINGVGLRVEGVVLGHFENVVCSTNRQLMTSRPLRGVVLDVDPTDGRRASANLWTNLIIEGMIEDGIHYIAADTQKFNGGTSENNGGNGVYIAPFCRVNSFDSFGFENGGYADVFDDGQMNRFINCYGTKKIYHGPNSSGHYVRGGYWQNVEGDINAISPNIDDIQFNFLGLPTPAGTFNVPSVTAEIGNNIRNVQAGSQYFHKKSKITVTPVSGTPIVNSYGIDVDIYVSGGTVTANQENRNGVAFGALPVSGKFFERPGDSITLTFSSAPTVFIVPRS